jgi:hypothetical protein
MTSYKVEQRHLTLRGRVFHFVSYEGHPANPRREEPAVEPTWFLMGPGRRWPVMLQHPSQAPDDVDRCLVAWLEENLGAATE